MLIDKSKFLLLVAAISTASAACIIVDDDDDGDGFGGDGQGAGNEGGGTTKSSTATGNDGGGGGTGGGGECLDDTGSPDACDSTCEALTNCNGTPNMKEGVEEAFVACVNELEPTGCSQTVDVLEGCFVTAAGQACIDPASDEICAAAAETCMNPGATFDGNCLGISDSLNASGQALWGACLEDACTTGSTGDDAINFCLYDVILPIAQ
ncbi:MAG: hypothetical protein HOV80_01550 [Polyangiaceae bacterium]|nr:hypothetical protein [Polyangiaceae bacterium]